ncbi:Fanconi anemia group A protein homolog isoform X2 [Crassostrea virginica]
MATFEEIIGSRQKVDILSQKSREELKNAVVQLVSFHCDNTVAVTEVADLVSSSTEREKGVLKLCISEDDQTEVNSMHTLEASVRSVLALTRNSQTETPLDQETKKKIKNLVFMMQELLDKQKFNRPRVLNLLCNEETLQGYLIWVLHKEDVMTLNTYLSFKASSQGFLVAFSSELYSNVSRSDKECWFLEMFALLVSYSVTATRDTDLVKVKKITKQILDLLHQKILDDLTLNSKTVNILDLTTYCPSEILKQYYQGQLSLWLAHRPVLKVSDALKQQKDWTFSRLSLSLTLWYKQLLLTLEPEEVLEQLKVVMETQEVNWQTVLSFLSTTVVCMPRFSELIREYIISLLRDGLESSNVENLVIAFLFARQCCLEGPHVFATYPDWYQGTFSEVNLTPAGNRKTFTCLIKFLTDMVPYDSSLHLKAHIVRPPFVPPKCRDLLTDYIMLAKTRLADLKQPLDGKLEDQDQESRKKVNEQIEEDIQKAITLFEASRKIPSSVMEASIFRKPYYVGKFLPVLLKPRALPDIPDTRMKFIDALKQVEKIPSTLYGNYLIACKAESSKLLEGVFLEEEEEMDIELSEAEQLQLRLDQLLAAILNQSSSRIVEHCSSLREKLLTVLNIDTNRAVQAKTSSSSVELNIDAADISSQKMKVVDQLLEFLAQASQRGVHMSDSLMWPQDLFTVLGEIMELHTAFLIRIWKLVIEQGCELDCHHIRTLSFCLVYIDHLNTSGVTLQACQGVCPALQGKFLHLIWQELPLSTSSWRKFAFRLMVEYVDSLGHCVRKIYSERQYFLPMVFCNKFQFLYGLFKDLSAEDDVNNDVGLLKEDIKSIIFQTKLPFREWIPLAMKIMTPDPDGELSLAEWQVHVYATVFNSYLLEASLLDGCSKESQWEMCGVLFTKLLHAECSLSPNFFPECETCRSRCKLRQIEKQHFFIPVLHTMVLNMGLGDQRNSWLSNQIKAEMEKRKSKLEKEFCVNAIFSVISCLPAYLLFKDSPSLPVVLDLPCQIINHSFTAVCTCGYFPARETIHLMQGLGQLANYRDAEIVLQECPFLLLSAMVHIEFTKNLIMPLCLSSTNPKLRELMKITDWVESCKTRTVVMPLELKVDDYCVSGALISLLHRRSSSLRQIIRIEARASEGQKHRILEGYAILLVSELISVKNTFYGEAEQALEDLLSLEPAILTSVANDVRNWVPLLPEHVLHMIPHTLLIFLAKRPISKLQNSLSFLSSLLLLYKELLQLMEETSENMVQMNEWVILIKFLEDCFKSATREQLQNLPKDLLSDCGADIVLLYQQNKR